MDYQKKYHKYKAKYLNLKHGGKTDKCVKSTLKKYTKRPSPPYPANECKKLKKKGNDGKVWISKPNKKGVYRWTKVNGCIKSTLKKYTKRPSPPYPANECKNLKKKGNDGNMWISKSNKKGIYKWVKLEMKKIPSSKAIKPLKYESKYEAIHNKEDIKAYVMKYKTAHFFNHEDDPYANKGVIKFSKYVKTSFEELYDNGIIAFIYPGWCYFIDDAWKYITDKIKNSKKIMKFIKDRWNVDHIDDVPFLFYMCPGEKSNDIWLKHHLTKEQGRIVYKILKKHFGKNYKWTKSPGRAMTLKFKEKTEPKPKYGAEWKEWKEAWEEWKEEYPGYKFIKKGTTYRWSSPKIEAMIKEYKEIRKKFIKLKRRDIAEYFDYESLIYPITPHISPLDAEKETEGALLDAKEILEQLEKGTFKGF